jgi:ribonuclease R
MSDKKSVQSIKQDVIDVVSNERGRPIPLGIIVKKLEREYNDQTNFKNNIYRAAEELIRTGELKQLKSKSVILGYVNAPVDLSKLQQGQISINSGGSGFITLGENRKASYYVFKTNLGGALDGDQVEFAEMQKPPRADLKDAVVTKVISHAKDFYVGIFQTNKDGSYKIKVDDEKFYLDIKLDSIQGLVNGQKILIQIAKYEGNVAFGSVSRVIGHVGDVGVDILSIVYDNGVEPDFSDPVLDYARKIKIEIDDYQRSIRKDLTNLPIVTIDPATSKDFDDAIYAKKLEDGKFFLSVSIADVSHYVRFKSILDEEALKRGCSIYLVDRVIPMLPHNLSDDICSLNPNVERLTLTCDMRIRTNGEIEDIKVYPSIIKSHRRFSYDEVNAFFNKTDDLSTDSNEVKTMLLESLELHQILDKAKKQRGYINFEIPEPIIVVNDKCVPIEIKKYESGTAQHMIEDFMVAANEAVTIYAEKQK